MAGGGAEDLPHHPSPHLTLTGAVQDSSGLTCRLEFLYLGCDLLLFCVFCIANFVHTRTAIPFFSTLLNLNFSSDCSALSPLYCNPQPWIINITGSSWARLFFASYQCCLGVLISLNFVLVAGFPERSV